MATKMAGRLTVRNERRLLHAMRCGIQWLLCRDGGVRWREKMPQSVRRQTRIVIRSFWPCGAEWRPLGSSAHVFCMTAWMPNPVFRWWKITCGLSYLAGKISMNLFSRTMTHRHTLHWAYVPGWIRSLRDVGWDDEDLTNGVQEVQISRPVTFSCEAEQRRRCTGQNLAQWRNQRTGFGTLSPTSHTTSCRRLWNPSPAVWGSWWMPPVPTLNFKLYVHIPI